MIDCERSRTKTHENTAYLASIRQVRLACGEAEQGTQIQQKGFALVFTVLRTVTEATVGEAIKVACLGSGDAPGELKRNHREGDCAGSIELFRF